MDYYKLIYAAYIIIAASFILNFLAGIALLRKPKRKPLQDISAKDLIHDLTTRGTSVVRIEVIDADSLFMRLRR